MDPNGGSLPIVHVQGKISSLAGHTKSGDYRRKLKIISFTKLPHLPKLSPEIKTILTKLIKERPMIFKLTHLLLLSYFSLLLFWFLLSLGLLFLLLLLFPLFLYFGLSPGKSSTSRKWGESEWKWEPKEFWNRILDSFDLKSSSRSNSHFQGKKLIFQTMCIPHHHFASNSQQSVKL